MLLKSILIPDNWVEKISRISVVGNGDDIKSHTNPLILDGELLYIARYWQYQKDLADIILKKADEQLNRKMQIDIDYLEKRLNTISSLFEELPVEIDWQRVAVFASLYNDFTIITGGPGTGKTTVVSVLMALFIEHNP